MLLQPFSLTALRLFLRHHVHWCGDVHHRHQVPGIRRWQKMDEIRRELQKIVRRFRRGEGLDIRGPRWRILLSPRPLGMRQDNDAADDRRVRVADGGEILLDGEDVTFKRASERDIAIVFQLFALYPHMNVRRNIAFPLAQAGRPEIRSRWKRPRVSCASSIYSTNRSRDSQAATGSGLRSDVRSCESRKPS